jgi:hypothetical protein
MRPSVQVQAHRRYVLHGASAGAPRLQRLQQQAAVIFRLMETTTIAIGTQRYLQAEKKRSN